MLYASLGVTLFAVVTKGNLSLHCVCSIFAAVQPVEIVYHTTHLFRMADIDK